MIDFHNHVLPDADDGPVTLEQSLNMLRSASEQGITEVVNTIHYQHPKVEHRGINHKDAKEKIEALRAALEEENLPVQLHLGAEVFYLPNLLQLKDDPLCTFEHGKYMLVEFPFHILPSGYDRVLFNLVMIGVTPVLAHPERTKPIQDDPGILRRLIRSGCLVQMDAGSITGSLGHSARRASKVILEQGLCQVIGSDAHNDKKRNFCLAEAVESTRKIVGEAVIDMVTTHPRMILQGEPIDTEVAMDYIYREPTFFEKIKRRFAH